MAHSVDTGFDNNERLIDVREKVLNPLAVRVSGLLRDTAGVQDTLKSTFNDFVVDTNTKVVSFKKVDGPDKDLDISALIPEIPEFPGISVDGESTQTSNVKSIKFRDATAVKNNNSTDISYDWSTLVKANQRDLIVKVGVLPTDTHNIKTIDFKNPKDKVEVQGDVLNITFPDSTPALKAQINGGQEQIIDTVNLTGNTASSAFTGNTLNINIPDGGGSGGITNQNFKGFFTSLGDLESEVTDAVNGRSYAFVQDHLIQGGYYTPFFYVNGGWTELKQDPALTYSGPSDPQTHGVVSIKPDDRIRIDKNGQLDLAGLSIDESKLYFHGFYATMQELTADITNPVLDKSFAYVRHDNGAWIGRVWRNTSSGNRWEIMAPLGGMSLVASPGDPGIPAPVYGLYKNGMVDIDANGIITIKGNPDDKIEVDIKDRTGASNKRDVKNIEFTDSSSLASFSGETLVLGKAQKNIEYNATWESQHNTMEYMGNIFYDTTSRSWMGWSVPEAPGAVGNKWTRIAHEGMSDEVKSLNYRFPRFIPEVAPGPTGDVRNWEFSSWTYLQADSSELPDPIQSVGGYLTTFVRKTQDEVGAPSKRIQQCIADNTTGDTFVRKFNSNAGTGEQSWHDWVKISMSQKDIDRHDRDPNAHKGLHKFYRVLTLDMTYALLKSYAYSIRDKQMLLMADSHGMGDIADEHTVIPYDGRFNLSGRFAMEGWTGTAINTQWVFKVARIRSGVTTVIYEATYNNTNTPKIHLPPIEWDFKGAELLAGDKLVYSFKCLNDTTFSSAYPALRILPNRSYFVIEDARTISGSRIAETQRKLQGALNTKDSVGINVHYASGTSGSIRMYGAAIPSEYRPMTQV